MKHDDRLTVDGYPQLKNNGRMSVEASLGLLYLRNERKHNMSNKSVAAGENGTDEKSLTAFAGFPCLGKRRTRLRCFLYIFIHFYSVLCYFVRIPMGTWE